MMTAEELEPVQVSVEVPLAVPEAFALWTERIHTWWPSELHSIGEDKVARVVFEQKLGGRVYEVWRDGTECDWGRVIAWDPPRRFALSWQPNPDAPAATEVAVTFAEGSVAGTTRVALEHRAWERLGAVARKARTSYASGWARNIEIFAAAAAAGR